MTGNDKALPLRLRVIAMIAHASHPHGSCPDGEIIAQAADQIEEMEAEIGRLTDALCKAGIYPI